MMKILRLLSFALLKMTEVSKNRSEKDGRFQTSPIRSKGLKASFMSRSYPLCSKTFNCPVHYLFFLQGNQSGTQVLVPNERVLMLMPYSEESVMKINNRVIGTVGDYLSRFS